MRNPKLLILFIVLITPYFLSAQRKKPNKGFGLSTSTTNFTYLSAPQFYPLLAIQLQFLYLPQPQNIVSFSAGTFLGFSSSEPFRPLNSLWISADYIHLNNYGKKKKTHFIYGAKLDLGIGRFRYASLPYGGAFESYYKRLLACISPQAGVLVKSGKKNFLLATFSVGIAHTFVKITQAPANSYKYGAFAPLSLRLSYNYLFKRKR